ncbi:MAG: haloacid dehalogenase [Cyanobacteria bacterium J06628_6]
MMPSSVFLTSLDDTLLTPTGRTAVKPAVAQLIAQQIPLILVTSKTQAEVAEWSADLGLVQPFIVENGSALYIPADAPFAEPPGEREGDHYVVTYGGPYVQARAGLRVLANELHHSLLGYGDMTIERLQRFTGLSAQAAQRAKARAFSESFFTPKTVTADALEQAAESIGFRVVRGDRVSYLLSATVNCQTAIAQLLSLYQARSPQSPLVTVGLGSQPEDLEMLTAVERAIVIPQTEGPHPSLADKNWTVADAPGPEGWATTLTALAQESS